MSPFHPATRPGTLRACPDCGGQWPDGPSHKLQGTSWLYDLPRGISQSNFDCLVHDFAHGPDRFLLHELKGPNDWPLPQGQQWLLQALARQPRWTVNILRGTTDHALLYRVTADGISAKAITTHLEAVRRAIKGWLAGALWRDVEEGLASKTGDHTCAWARVEGVWTCIQDFYAAGYRPDTACGATLPQYR